jgi:ACS family hexuronate transporter-like MFS transporter
MGLLWIPVWLAVARRARALPAPKMPAGGGRELLRDPRLWRFVIANALAMIGYSLWTNWTTKFLVKSYGLTVPEAASYAWFPPLAAMAGGFAAGASSLWLAKRGMAIPAARFRACLWMAVIALSAFAVPAAHSPLGACAAISASIFAVAGFSVNMYTLPLDVFGGARAAFAVSILVASYGGVQAVISPAFGRVIDLYGYSPVIAVAALTPLAACAVLRGALK